MSSRSSDVLDRIAPGGGLAARSANSHPDDGAIVALRFLGANSELDPQMPAATLAP